MKNIPRIFQLKWFLKSTEKNVVRFSDFRGKVLGSPECSVTYLGSQSQAAAST